MPGDPHLPAGDRGETGERAHERRLPRAGGAEQGDHFAGKHDEVDAVEHVRPGVVAGDGEVAHRDEGERLPELGGVSSDGSTAARSIPLPRAARVRRLT